MNDYTQMQKSLYENEANEWSPTNRDPVVGSFDLQNKWKDYDEFLFKDIDLTSKKLVLDFGCGPGRSIVKYNEKFERIDGVDITQKNIDNAKLWIEKNDCKKSMLFLCNGRDLNSIPNETYDIVMSTICFQHICVYEIRKNYLAEFNRVLKPGGSITIQMGFGGSPRSWANYHENASHATSTNGHFDVSVEDPEDLRRDIEEVRLKNFKYYIRPTGPGDFHKNWIFFNAIK